MFGDRSRLSHEIEFDVRRFYECFAEHRNAFLEQIQGDIPRCARDNYGALMLNRIIVLYFLQAAGLLNGELDYLPARLRQVQCHLGAQAFYRCFLLRLFHEGLSTAHPCAGPLFGRLPRLGSGIFPPHTLEMPCYQLHIPDEAFARLFAFFDTYRWCLDESSPQTGQMITPTILGAIFELYVNQQQMGAYYTRSDVTSYIARNTVLPCLFDAIGTACTSAETLREIVRQLLQRQPDRYIPAPIRDKTYLPGETEREYTARCAYCADLRERILRGAISPIDDLVTYNLDIQQCFLDLIETIDQPALLLACYTQLRQMAILDPTCGSGAFLFSVLNLLVPFYEACFVRMQALNLCSGCAGALAAWREAPDPHYVILKEIIAHNLYGVDIMPEAIEVCRLRFVLRLLSHIKHIEDVEPLSTLTVHFRVGNALCPFPSARTESVTEESPGFSWHDAFPEVWARGGFAVIIGNPPYVEYHTGMFPYALRDFETLPCANLYPCVIERCRQLLMPGGRHGMVVPLAAFATRNMQPLLDGFRRWFPSSWVSFYHFRPAMLFSGQKVASIPTAIYLTKTVGPEQRFSTHLLKWSQDQRHLLFSRLTYCPVTVASDPENRHYYPKFGRRLENVLMEKILRQRVLREYLAPAPNANTMFYRSAGGLYWKVFVNFPWPYSSTSNKQCSFQEPYLRDVFVAVLNSSLFWWYYTVTFDTFNLKDYMLFGFRFTYPTDPALLAALIEQCSRLMVDFRRHAQHRTRGKTGSYTIYAKRSRPIIDKIDRLLAHHYGLTTEELDFILHYDALYRSNSQIEAEKGQCFKH